MVCATMLEADKMKRIASKLEKCKRGGQEIQDIRWKGQGVSNQDKLLYSENENKDQYRVIVLRS